MPGSSGGGQNPPSWWSVDLYSFINDSFSLEGWVWEFMRRAKLFERPTDAPVEAMNPNPELEDADYDYRDYYRPWNDSKWSNKPPVFLPPSSILPGRWPINFAGQRYRLDDEDLREMVEVRIDLNRRDKVIRRDFDLVLRELREEMPEPQRVYPRLTDWVAQHILEVWDLRQLGVSWSNIATLLGLGCPNEDRRGAIQPAINSYNTSKSYIEGGKWINLARYIEPCQLLEETTPPSNRSSEP